MSSVLQRAKQLQDWAASKGYDWPNIMPVIEKVFEEIEEFKEAVLNKDSAHALEELGDILFVCVNLARHLKADPEKIMEKANAKFERRFQGIADRVERSGREWQDFSLEELDEFWQEVKAAE